MLVRAARIIAPFTCDCQWRSGFRGIAEVRTRVLGARSGAPLPAAGSGGTAAQGGPLRGVRRILARSLGSERSLHENRPRAAHLPGADLHPAAVLVRAG